MKPIGPLMWEHRLIEQMVALLRGEIDRITSRKTVNVILVEQAVDFFRTYADRTHHGKEEELLFPALEAAGIKREGGPIGVMLEEHEQGREYVRRMNTKLSEYRAGEAEAGAAFIREARGYIALLDQHTHKEDTVLFPIAEKQISAARQAEMSNGFERIEVEKIGVGRHEEFHRMLDHLENYYLR